VSDKTNKKRGRAQQFGDSVRGGREKKNKKIKGACGGDSIRRRSMLDED
jgi:hypothetical protein